MTAIRGSDSPDARSHPQVLQSGSPASEASDTPGFWQPIPYWRRFPCGRSLMRAIRIVALGFAFLSCLFGCHFQTQAQNNRQSEPTRNSVSNEVMDKEMLAWELTKKKGQIEFGQPSVRGFCRNYGRRPFRQSWCVSKFGQPNRNRLRANRLQDTKPCTQHDPTHLQSYGSPEPSKERHFKTTITLPPCG